MTQKRHPLKQAPGEYRDPLHPERKLVTRRDFLSSGLVKLGAAVTMPSVIHMVMREREARAGTLQCAGGASINSGLMPFLIFDCAGGAALPGNWIPTDRAGLNGQPLSTYSRLGLGAPVTNFSVDRTFGTPMAGKVPNNQAPDPTMISEVLDVLLNDMSFPPEVRACLRMGVICHTSLSDSQSNQISPISLITAAGLQGTRVKNGLGTMISQSAGYSDAASLDAAFKPMGVLSVDALTLALSYGPAFAGLPVRLKESLAKALVNLSASQAQKLSNLNLGDQFAALAQCGFIKNVDYTTDVGGIDARQDPVVSGIYGLSGNSDPSGDALVATLVKNAVEGNSGPATIVIGGCDYHDGTNTSGADANTRIGTNIARALRVAYAKGKKVAFMVCTDGGITSMDNTRKWAGDSNDAGMTVFGIMDPAGPREMVSYQINRYTDGQSADRNHFLGTDVVAVAHTVLLNYLAACGQVGRYAEIAAARIVLPLDKLDQFLLFPNKA